MKKQGTCPKCGEFKKVSISVTSPSERRPLPIWKYTCRECRHAWTVDENVDAT